MSSQFFVKMALDSLESVTSSKYSLQEMFSTAHKWTMSDLTWLTEKTDHQNHQDDGLYVENWFVAMSFPLLMGYQLCGN